METTDNKTITIESTINVPVQKVWEFWTEPSHITKWCNASDDWHAPSATNNLTVGGKFTTRMESKDGKEGFDFQGTYTALRPLEFIGYTLDDGRKAEVTFLDQGETTHITQTFEPETINPIEMQRSGWQSILDNFKKYSEANR